MSLLSLLCTHFKRELRINFLSFFLSGNFVPRQLLVLNLFTLLFPDKIEVMTRYKATISYDGFAFAGFQRQPHARSVQEEIEKNLNETQ